MDDAIRLEASEAVEAPAPGNGELSDEDLDHVVGGLARVWYDAHPQPTPTPAYTALAF